MNGISFSDRFKFRFFEFITGNFFRLSKVLKITGPWRSKTIAKIMSTWAMFHEAMAGMETHGQIYVLRTLRETFPFRANLVAADLAYLNHSVARNLCIDLKYPKVDFFISDSVFSEGN